jgi:hypothetical protein
MKTDLTIVVMSLMLLSSALAQTTAPSGTVAGLPPDLRDAVLRDAACSQSDHSNPPKSGGLPSQLANTGQTGSPGPGTAADHPSPPKPGGPGTPAAESAPDKTVAASVSESAVAIQDIRNAKGTSVGAIVRFNDACHCQEANCGTYVFLKRDSGYRLAFSGGFLSLHPARVFKSGYPSLSGKVQLSKAQTESTVYDWNGKSYVPGLCATITQTAGRKVPGIVHHDCVKGSASGQNGPTPGAAAP